MPVSGAHLDPHWRSQADLLEDMVRRRGPSALGRIVEEGPRKRKVDGDDDDKEEEEEWQRRRMKRMRDYWHLG